MTIVCVCLTIPVVKIIHTTSSVADFRKYTCEIFEEDGRLLASSTVDNQYPSASAKAALLAVRALRDAADLAEAELIRAGILPPPPDRA